MTPKEAYLFRETIDLLRKEARKSFSDWRDADDWVFSELHFSKGELMDIFGCKPSLYIDSALEKSLPEPCCEGKWISTDDGQRVRWMNKRIFKVLDLMEIGEDTFVVIENIIDVENRLRCDFFGVEDILKAYGYESVEDVQKQYREYADQIIAECIAETEFSDGDVLLRGTEQECDDFFKFYAPIG